MLDLEDEWNKELYDNAFSLKEKTVYVVKKSESKEHQNCVQVHGCNDWHHYSWFKKFKGNAKLVKILFGEIE